MTDTEAFLKGKFIVVDLSLEIYHLRKYLFNDDSMDYLTLQSSVANNNLGFITLWKNNRKAAALTFIRILSEHLVYIYAEYLYPEKVIRKIYNKNKELNQIRIEGVKIKPSEIRKKIIEDYPDFQRIWEEYHKFIHPSINQSFVGIGAGLDVKGLSDIVKVNKWIVDVLTKIKGNYKRYLKYKGEYQQYKEWLKNLE